MGLDPQRQVPLEQPDEDLLRRVPLRLLRRLGWVASSHRRRPPSPPRRRTNHRPVRLRRPPRRPFPSPSRPRRLVAVRRPRATRPPSPRPRPSSACDALDCSSSYFFFAFSYSSHSSLILLGGFEGALDLLELLVAQDRNSSMRCSTPRARLHEGGSGDGQVLDRAGRADPKHRAEAPEQARVSPAARRRPSPRIGPRRASPRHRDRRHRGCSVRRRCRRPALPSGASQSTLLASISPGVTVRPDGRSAPLPRGSRPRRRLPQSCRRGSGPFPPRSPRLGRVRTRPPVRAITSRPSRCPLTSFLPQ